MDTLLKFYGKDIQDMVFNEWLNQKPEVLKPIAEKWFNVMMHCGQLVQGIFHDGYPIVCVESAPFAYVNAFTSHVNVGFFYGFELPDKLGLLEGGGKRMRHIKLFPGKEHHNEEIESLIQLAYADILERLMKESY